MSLERSFDAIVKRPVVSEKSYAGMSTGRYAFRCHPAATKVDIKRAIEEAFESQKITVLSVNTLNVRGRERRRSRGKTRIVGRSPGWKKAVVTLAPGQKIEGLFEGV